jgi:hypothetical protein
MKKRLKNNLLKNTRILIINKLVDLLFYMPPPFNNYYGYINKNITFILFNVFFFVVLQSELAF